MKTLQKILCMPDKELGSYLIQALKKYYKHVETDRDNYIYARGTGEICLVAHIDTVRGKTDEPVMLSINRNVIRNTKGVLGADDRAGVYGILEVLKSCMDYKIALPSVIFTNYEERGGAGVRKFVASKKFHPDGIKLLVELDRKGCNEYVFYSTFLPKPVKDYIESFGFKEERGSYSDIADLTNEYGIPSVNLSIGYYLQHTSNERLHYDELLMTIDRVVDICADPISKLHLIEKPTFTRHGGYHGGSGFSKYNGYGYGDDYDYYAYNKAANSAFNAPKTTTSVLDKTTVTSPAVSPENTVTRIVISLRAELQTTLANKSSLDEVGLRYINHEHALAILGYIDLLEEAYNKQIVQSRPEDTAFINAWNELMTKMFQKQDPKQATTALACTH